MHQPLPSRPSTILPAGRHLVDVDGAPACESNAEAEFIAAMHDYKKTSGRLFPTWSEVLEVAQNLGYAKAAASAAVVA